MDCTSSKGNRPVQCRLPPVWCGAPEVEGRTVHAAIEDRRLEIAEKLLSETSWTVRKISTASGYSSAKTFNAAFHRRFGLSPLSARQMTHSTPDGALQDAPLP